MAANYTHTTRSANAILTAAQYNADHQNHIDHMTPTYIDDYSTNAAEMRTQSDPGESGSESLATTLAGEMARLRYAVWDTKRFIDPTLTYWYQTPSTAGQPFLNVLAHGVTGDGSTNDRAAIQTLLDTGEHLFFPPGTYNIGSTLNLTTSGQQIFGMGQNSTIKATAASFNVFTVNSASISDVHLRNLRIQGAATSDATTQFALFTDATHVLTHLRVENVLFSGPASNTGLNNAIKLDSGSNYAVITGCVFDRLQGTISGTGYGVLMGGSSYNTIAENVFIASLSTSRHAVYLSAGSTYNRVVGNYIEGFSGGAITADASNAQPTNAYNLIGWNTLKGCNNNSSDGAISTFRNDVGTKIIGNVINSAGQAGVMLDSQGSTLTDIQVCGNTINNSGTWGIIVRGVARPSVIGNHVYGSSASSSGTYADIDIRRDSTNAVTTSGALVASNAVPASSTGRAPVNVDTSAPAPTSLVFKGNYFPTGSVLAATYGTPTSASTNPIVDSMLNYTSGATAFTVTNPLASGSAYSQNFTVYGAASGDRVAVTTNASISGSALSGFVSSSDTVSVTIMNLSGGNLTVGNIQVYITIFKTSV